MNRIRHIHRYVAVLAGLAFAWLGLAAAAPAAFAASAVIPVGDDGGTAAAPASGPSLRWSWSAACRAGRSP